MSYRTRRWENIRADMCIVLSDVEAVIDDIETILQQPEDKQPLPHSVDPEIWNARWLLGKVQENVERQTNQLLAQMREEASNDTPD